MATLQLPPNYFLAPDSSPKRSEAKQSIAKQSKVKQKHSLHPLARSGSKPATLVMHRSLSQWREHSIQQPRFLEGGDTVDSYRPQLFWHSFASRSPAEKKQRTRAGVVGACGTDPFEKSFVSHIPAQLFNHRLWVRQGLL